MLWHLNSSVIDTLPLVINEKKDGTYIVRDRQTPSPAPSRWTPAFFSKQSGRDCPDEPLAGVDGDEGGRSSAVPTVGAEDRSSRALNVSALEALGGLGSCRKTIQAGLVIFGHWCVFSHVQVIKAKNSWRVAFQAKHNQE